MHSSLLEAFDFISVIICFMFFPLQHNLDQCNLTWPNLA